MPPLKKPALFFKVVSLWLGNELVNVTSAMGLDYYTPESFPESPRLLWEAHGNVLSIKY
jgi:hypothetical protein